MGGGWGPEKSGKLANFAKKPGFSPYVPTLQSRADSIVIVGGAQLCKFPLLKQYEFRIHSIQFKEFPHTRPAAGEKKITFRRHF